MQFTYTTQLLKEGDTYVAYSPEFDLSSCGDTADDARRMLHEALGLFVAEAQRKGTFESILEEAGYRQRDHEWQAPEFVGVERSAFAV